ncbi:molybdate ABC transporter permease subunit [Azospirillum doebereinerae]|uniref:Molybdenum transport system permease n=1 Tax=Azospirillum doebereinerae TaxID=92933 RepID=A0A433J858_9PROT|nr:molybdate ABC transporter permease subunit [Azospirillum doebereinerae]MCG5241759.1 molybdate ABC transporter permease subunit [Azospirillum doebereinerae]RUQ70160.1 molybdate ABC transporter permease subunit [Azospirillum doebereinerae]
MDFLSPMETTALLLSLRVAGLAIVVSLPLAVLAAWILGRYSFPGKTLFDGLVHLPLVLPPVVVGYILLITMGTKGVIGGWLLQTFGIRLIFTTEGASLAVAVTSFPLMVRAIRLSVEAIDTGLEAAARTLGAGPVDRFFTIVLPLMAPGLLSGAIVAFAAAMGEFGAVITFVSNIPGKTQTLPLAIYAATQEPGGDAMAARLATISFSVALIALMVSEFLAHRLRRLIGQG